MNQPPQAPSGRLPGATAAPSASRRRASSIALYAVLLATRAVELEKDALVHPRVAHRALHTLLSLRAERPPSAEACSR